MIIWNRIYYDLINLNLHVLEKTKITKVDIKELSGYLKTEIEISTTK